MSDGYTKSIPVTFSVRQVAPAQSEPDEEKITVVEDDTGKLDEKVEKDKKR